MKPPRSDKLAILIAAGTLLGAQGVAAVPVWWRPSVAASASASAPTPPEFAAAYPDVQPGAPGAGPGASRTAFAGVDLARLAAFVRERGLVEHAREAFAPEDGGLVLSFADAAGRVRLVVTLAVADDDVAARAFVASQLLGVSAGLLAAPAHASLDGPAYTDGDGGARMVVAARVNVGYAVRALAPQGETRPAPSAREVAAAIVASLAPGVPARAPVAPSLPAWLAAKQATPIVLPFVPSAGPGPAPAPTLTADGAYVAAGPRGPVLKPFGPGPVTLTATFVDSLGRVTIARASSVAR